MATERICTIEGCGKPLYGRGYCNMHWQRWRRHGDPTGGRAFNGTPEQYFREVALSYDGEDCLIWPFGRRSSGYARINFQGTPIDVHLLVCQHVHGPQPTPDHQAAHSCGNGHLACINPKHLRWATHAENTADKLIHGTMLMGERHGNAKLTEADVRQIRALKGTLSEHELGAMFGVNYTNIHAIHVGRSWAWLQPSEDEGQN